MGEGDSVKISGEGGMEEKSWPNATTSPALWGLAGCVYLWLLPTSEAWTVEWEVGGLGGREGNAGSGCGQWLQGCQGSVCAGSASLAGRNGMFPLALQEQKQLWNNLKRQLLSEKVMYTIVILK